MTIKIEGQRDPKRLAREARTAAVRIVLARHTGKRIAQLPAPALAEIVEVLAQALGLADDAGILISPD